MTDLAKAIKRVSAFADERDIEAMLMVGASRVNYQVWINDVRTVCDAAERASRVTVEDVARVIASALGDDFDHAFINKSEWNAARGDKGGRYRDINEPMKNDYVDAATAVMALIRSE
jgi:hypothetical protein